MMKMQEKAQKLLHAPIVPAALLVRTRKRSLPGVALAGSHRKDTLLLFAYSVRSPEFLSRTPRGLLLTRNSFSLQDVHTLWTLLVKNSSLG